MFKTSIKTLIEKDNIEGVEKLLAGGFDINKRMNRYGETPLMQALTYRKEAIARLLIERGADLDLVNIFGSNALMRTCTQDAHMPNTAKLLIERGADVNLVNVNGMSALLMACKYPQPDIAKLLIERGAVLDLVDESGWSALMHACKNSQADTAKLLIERGANLNLKNKVGDTAMDIAVKNDRYNTLKVLFIPREQKSGKGSIAKRMSNRLSGIFTKDFKYDVFLTHDWGIDELDRNNHERVSNINNVLSLHFKTWFDGERLTGNIIQQMENGIRQSKVVVVFITQRYMLKLMTEEEDNCKSEFLAAANMRGVKNMLFVVMEPRMRNQNAWMGPLMFKAGSEFYVDFAGGDDHSVDSLVERIREKLQKI